MTDVVYEMTYNVLTGTLNPTIPHHTSDTWSVVLNSDGTDDGSAYAGQAAVHLSRRRVNDGTKCTCGRRALSRRSDNKINPQFDWWLCGKSTLAHGGGLLPKVQGRTGPEAMRTWLHSQAVLWDMPVSNPLCGVWSL